MPVLFPPSLIFVLRGKKSAQLSAIISGAWEISQMGEVSIRESSVTAGPGKLKVWPNVTEIRRSLS